MIRFIYKINVSVGNITIKQNMNFIYSRKHTSGGFIHFMYNKW